MWILVSDNYNDFNSHQSSENSFIQIKSQKTFYFKKISPTFFKKVIFEHVIYFIYISI
jgi:hypothetical protein